MKHWILGLVAGLFIGAIGTSMAAPRSARGGLLWLRPNQSGIFVWSPSTGDYLRLDVVVQAMQLSHNDLVRRIGELERATNTGRD